MASKKNTQILNNKLNSMNETVIKETATLGAIPPFTQSDKKAILQVVLEGGVISIEGRTPKDWEDIKELLGNRNSTYNRVEARDSLSHAVGGLRSMWTGSNGNIFDQLPDTHINQMFEHLQEKVKTTNPKG